MAVAVVDDKDMFSATRLWTTIQPAESKALFEVGSVTKTFVGTTMAALVGKGTLAMDDGVGRYVPEIGPNWGQVTLLQLATHRGGVPQGQPPPGAPAEDPFFGVDDDYVVRSLADQDPTGVGRPRYSNFGYVLLGLAMSRAADCSLVDLVHREVLRPLEMSQTTLLPDVSGHMLVPGHRLANGERLPPLGASLPAAGGIRSNAADMAVWVRANLDPSTTAISAALEVAQRLHATARPGRGWGLGWRRDGPTAWLPGATSGFSCLCYLHLDHRRGYVWMINAGIGSESNATFALARRGIPFAVSAYRTHRQLRRPNSSQKG